MKKLEFPRLPDGFGIDAPLVPLVTKAINKQSTEENRRVTKNDLYNLAIRDHLQKVGIIKKGDPLWKD